MSGGKRMPTSGAAHVIEVNTEGSNLAKPSTFQRFELDPYGVDASGTQEHFQNPDESFLADDKQCTFEFSDQCRVSKSTPISSTTPVVSSSINASSIRYPPKIAQEPLQKKRYNRRNAKQVKTIRGWVDSHPPDCIMGKQEGKQMEKEIELAESKIRKSMSRYRTEKKISAKSKAKGKGKTKRRATILQQLDDERWEQGSNIDTPTESVDSYSISQTPDTAIGQTNNLRASPPAATINDSDWNWFDEAGNASNAGWGPGDISNHVQLLDQYHPINESNHQLAFGSDFGIDSTFTNTSSIAQGYDGLDNAYLASNEMLPMYTPSTAGVMSNVRTATLLHPTALVIDQSHYNQGVEHASARPSRQEMKFEWVKYTCRVHGCRREFSNHNEWENHENNHA